MKMLPNLKKSSIRYSFDFYQPSYVLPFTPTENFTQDQKTSKAKQKEGEGHALPQFLAEDRVVSNGGKERRRRLKFRPQNTATSETDGPTSTTLLLIESPES